MSETNTNPEARAIIEAALKANEGDMVPCDRCDGRGWHHGFGERGHDPDWCVKCDGSQVVHSGVEPADAIIAALAAEGMKILARQPTKAMMKTMGISQSSYIVNDWGRMWDAAPAPTLPPAGDER